MYVVEDNILSAIVMFNITLLAKKETDYMRNIVLELLKINNNIKYVFSIKPNKRN